MKVLARHLACPILVLLMLVALAGCDLFKEWGFIPPDAASGLMVADATVHSLKIAWKGSTGATSYQLYRATDTSGPWTNEVYNESETSFTDMGLSAGTAYYYALLATNAAGSSSLSEVASGLTSGVATPVITISPEPDSEGYIYSNISYSVTIKCSTSGASIYFTTDGSTPSTDSDLYSGPFWIFYGTNTVKAIAVKSGTVDSEIAVAYYSWW